MWISVIAVGVILGTILIKDRQNKKQPAYIPVKVKDQHPPKR